MKFLFRNKKQTITDSDKNVSSNPHQQEQMKISKKVNELEKKIELYQRLKKSNQNEQMYERLNELEKKLSNVLISKRQNTNRENEQEIKRTFEMENKIDSLYKKIQHLEEKLSSFENSNRTEQNSSSPTFFIDHLNVESIVIDKLDYANNFGQLGIKELSGRLNIGTSYDGMTTPKKAAEKLEKQKAKEDQAKVNIQGKKEKHINS